MAQGSRLPPSPAAVPRPSVTGSFNATSRTYAGILTDTVASAASRNGIVYIDGVVSGTVTTAADGSYSFVPPQNAGTHSLQVIFGTTASPIVNASINATGPFSVTLGANLTVMGFAQGSRYQWTTTAFDATCSLAWGADRLVQTEQTYRYAVDPSPLLGDVAAGTATSADLAVVKHGIDRLLGFGFKVIVDSHVGGGSGEPTWTVANIQNDYSAYAAGSTTVANNKWNAYLAYVALIAGLLNSYAPGHVAFEQFNEPTIAIGGGWPTMARSIWNAFRAVNTQTTVMVAGTHYAGQDGLNELTASNFDTNTIFVVHSYDPQQFTYQGFAGGPAPKSTGFPYPMPRSEQIALMAVLITATGLAIMMCTVSGTTATVTTPTAHGLATGAYVSIIGGNTSPTLPSAITVTSTTTFTVAVPSGYTWAAGSYTTYVTQDASYQTGMFNSAPFGLDENYLISSVFAPVLSWASSNGVPTSRIVYTESGCRGVVKQGASDINGPDLVSEAMYTQDFRRLARGYGFGLIYFTDDPAITNLFNWRQVTGGLAVEPARVAALGRVAPRSRFEREAGDFLARFTVTPSNKRCTHINAIYRLFKSAQLDVLIDYMFLPAMVNAAAGYPTADAKLNWFPKAPSLSFLGNYAAVEYGTGTWSDNLGYASDGSTGYLDTLFIPGTTPGGLTSQNLMSLIVHSDGTLSTAGTAVLLGNSNANIAPISGGFKAGLHRSAGLGGNGATLHFNPLDVPVGIMRIDAAGDYIFERNSQVYSGTTLVGESAKPSTTMSAISHCFGRSGTTNYTQAGIVMRSGLLAAFTTFAQMRTAMTIMSFAYKGLASSV